MMLLFFMVVLPCVLARKTQFVVETVQAAPTDVIVRLETHAPSKTTCSALCSSKDYISFRFTLETHTCHCFSDVSEQVEQDVNGTSEIFYGKQIVCNFLFIKDMFLFTTVKYNRYYRFTKMIH